ncbi:MAG: alpha-ketoacid dehydrogenase subunit beta [Actinobacteria bacterium]|jgi:pyruvate dehydrogenase E1 component beta subunit|nr:alpha-ketoacid dehydrogenase subunit beta [Actinomycetota bacterium]|tara:strand:+ start:3954 stop:4925 length:972 start_codon:yes stop_codon:yes gene_type:complete
MYVEALNEAIFEEMDRDESVYYMGEDVRASIYGASRGLFEKYGEKRVLDTPLSENGFIGAAIGSSLVGMRPIVETLTSFMWVAMDQIISQAAKMKYMFGGQASLPVTIRAVMSYGGSSAAHHSDRSYPMFMNMPGLKIIAPASPEDVKGLMKTSVRDNDPCIIFEDSNLAGIKGDVPENNDLNEGELLIPFGKGKIIREGSDCTVVGIAGANTHALNAATELEKEGISVEIIDPRTLVPLDKEIILNSVEKTGRLVVVDPAHKVCSAASEIISVVTEEGFWNLQAPPVKIAAEQVHIPFTPALEPLIFPDAEKIINAVKQTIE